MNVLTEIIVRLQNKEAHSPMGAKSKMHHRRSTVALSNAIVNAEPNSAGKLMTDKPKSTAKNNDNNDNNNHEELSKIQKILSKKHDPKGDVGKHICNCLLEDDLTFELLSNFDDKSLQETIESWNIKSIHKKPHIIRGLLINGIKKIQQENIRAVAPKQIVLTEKEALKREQLTKLEENITNELKQFENDSKTREIAKDKLYNECKEKINATFDTLVDVIKTRREELLGKLDNLFKIKNKDCDMYPKQLENILIKINECKGKFARNLESTHGYDSIKSRSDTNCKLIDDVIYLVDGHDCSIMYNIDINDTTSSDTKTSDTGDDVHTAASKTGYECNVLFDTNKVDELRTNLLKLGKVESPSPRAQGVNSSDRGGCDHDTRDQGSQGCQGSHGVQNASGDSHGNGIVPICRNINSYNGSNKRLHKHKSDKVRIIRHNNVDNEDNNNDGEPDHDVDDEGYDDRHEFFGDNEENMYDLIYCDENYDDCINSIKRLLNYSAVLWTNKQESTLRCYLGTVYSRSDRPRIYQAKVEFEKSIELDNKNALAYYEYAAMLYDFEQYTKALKYYKKAYQLKPNVEEYKQDYDEAMQEIENGNLIDEPMPQEFRKNQVRRCKCIKCRQQI